MSTGRFSLEGRSAVVTGGGRGIGRSIALALAQAGADVAVVARTSAEIQSVANEVCGLGPKGLAITADVARPDDIERMSRTVDDAFGHIDILINNAGISPYYTRAEKYTPVMWDTVMAVNLRGLFFCSQTIGQVMIRQKKGVIVNVASATALVAAPRLVAYAAAKAAVMQLTKTLAIEWAPHGVRVNAVAPSYVVTEFTRGMRENEALNKMLIEMHPLGRLANPDDVAGAVLYLASDASSFVTGSVLLVDGGMTAR